MDINLFTRGAKRGLVRLDALTRTFPLVAIFRGRLVNQFLCSMYPVRTDAHIHFQYGEQDQYYGNRYHSPGPFWKMHCVSLLQFSFFILLDVGANVL